MLASIVLATLVVLFSVSAPAQADFGLESVEATAINADATTNFQAGSHPFKYNVDFAMNLNGEGLPEGYPEGLLSGVVAELPPGIVGNPFTLPHCKQVNFEGGTPQCPADSQIGVTRVLVAGFGEIFLPLYNLVPPAGVAGRIGFSLFGNTSFQDVSLRSDSDYGLTLTDRTIPNQPIGTFRETTWGVPAAEGHDSERSEECMYNPGNSCPSDVPPVGFLSMPTSCGEPLQTAISVESLDAPGVFDTKSAISSENGEPAGMDGCNALSFEPTVSSQPTTNLADSPTGLNFKLHVPQPPGLEQGSGAVETCRPGEWEGEPNEFTYRWLRNGVPIPGETSPSYVVGDADASNALQCEVDAANAFGHGFAVSKPLVIAPLPAVEAPKLAAVTVELQEGSATCHPTTGTEEPTLSYRWFENGSEVPGAFESTYTPLAEPFTLQCEVLASNAGGAAAAFSAGKTSSPAPEDPLPSPRSSFPPKAGPDEATIPLATAHLKDTAVVLPEGLVINPSVANGLAACSESEIGLIGTGFEPPNPIHFSKAPQGCPNASKVGTMRVRTPLLDHPVEGSVFIARPFENPFGSFMAIYLAVEDVQTGIVSKLAGKVTPDPKTGRLSTTFTENPQLPLEDIELSFFNGPKAALKTPLACGTYSTTTTLVPWSTPEGETVHPSDAFQTSVAAGGSGACPASEAAAPNKPSFSAGTIAPAAGAYSPFVLKVGRADGTQRITQIDTTLPKGLTGKLAGIPYCSETQLARAKSREAPDKGVLERQNPSCPAASEVGSVTVGAGSGVTPYYTSGKAYLAGPYKGAPLSLAIITPAVAGPFDLGAVVVRTPLYVDSETAQIHAVSDPLPLIIEGVPLDIRSIDLRLDRPSFTLNPTSCDPMQLLGSTTSTLGTTASLANSFQVGGCRSLKFKPKLAISLKGGTKRGRFPALKAVLTYPQGSSYANTASAQVTLPHGEFVEQAHFKSICTRVQFQADACPPGSIYGKARAITPLLDKPLEGPVYLRSSSHTLPDLVIALRGQVNVDLVGKVDTGKTGGIRTSFESAPDAPVSKVILQMQGGKKGLLVNSENICRKQQRALADLIGQNGKVSETRPLIKNSCKTKGKSKKKASKGRGGER
jgi:hypothetical protein